MWRKLNEMGETLMDTNKMREAVARAIWSVRREEEDRCDMELEDMGADHSVWVEADAAIEAMQEIMP